MRLLKWVVRLLPFAYMAAIWIMSGLPHNAIIELPDQGVDRFLKESLHLVEFGFLYLLLVGAVLTTGKFTPKVNYALMAIAALYGILDEVHQSFVPYRSASWIDIAKDLFGILAAAHFIHHGYFNGKFPKIAAAMKKVEVFFKKK